MITPKIESLVVFAIPDIPRKFQKDPSITFWVILLTVRQTNKLWQKHNLLGGGKYFNLQVRRRIIATGGQRERRAFDSEVRHNVIVKSASYQTGAIATGHVPARTMLIGRHVAPARQHRAHGTMGHMRAAECKTSHQFNSCVVVAVVVVVVVVVAVDWWSLHGIRRTHVLCLLMNELACIYTTGYIRQRCAEIWVPQIFTLPLISITWQYYEHRNIQTDKQTDRQNKGL